MRSSVRVNEDSLDNHGIDQRHDNCGIIIIMYKA